MLVGDDPSVDDALTPDSPTPTPGAVTYDFRGRVFLVTGVSRRQGIGAAIARQLAGAGADLVLHSWSPHDVERPGLADPDGAAVVAAECERLGARVTRVSADFADPSAPAQVMAQAVREHAHMDGVVANHARDGGGTLETIDAAELDLCFAVNARATALLVKEFAAQHDGRPGGRAVLFTSGQHHGGMPGELPYVISKGAVQQMTASLAVHLAPRGITVNCVNPGPTDTGWADEAQEQWVRERMPQGRWGTADDAARLVTWLLSDDGQWICGQTLDSEGGFGR